ncbi:hypothetical protein DVH05_009195 [Phytophthora capsici]|nr:hypothetical protein DVH05_009195 [Phytophthora capsici]
MGGFGARCGSSSPMMSCMNVNNMVVREKLEFWVKVIECHLCTFQFISKTSNLSFINLVTNEMIWLQVGSEAIELTNINYVKLRNKNESGRLRTQASRRRTKQHPQIQVAQQRLGQQVK